tara:strand:+ start:4531 stop:5373 length:843 start_codon:yes stop_codon:yes gene_type:complete
MAITGGIKFFKKNEMAGATASATSGDAAAKFLLDLDVDTYWTSVGSSDSETETITINFGSNKTINRILLLDHNFKNFTVKYLSGSSYVAFSNVIGIGGVSLSGITETTFSQDSSYYEFDSVTTTSIQIACLSTQTTNAEKYLSQAIGTSEIGTFVGYPQVSKIDLSRNTRSKKTLSGRYSVQKSQQTIGYSIKFRNYPSSTVYNVDIDLALTLFESEDPFLIYPCGGRYESKHFSYQLPGFRLKDCILSQIRKSYSLKYVKNIYTNPLDVGGLETVPHIL